MKFQGRYSSKRHLLVLGLLALTIIGVGYLMSNTSQKDRQSEQTHKTASPTPTTSTAPTPDRQGTWNTYTNALYGYSVQYPPHLVPNEQPDARYNHAPDDFYLFRMCFENPEEAYSYYFTGLCIGVKKGNALTLNVEVAYWEWRIVGHISDRIETKSNIAIAGYEGVRLDYEVSTTNPSTEERRKKLLSTIIFTNGTYLYVLEAPAELMDRVTPTFTLTATRKPS